MMLETAALMFTAGMATVTINRLIVVLNVGFVLYRTRRGNI